MSIHRHFFAWLASAATLFAAVPLTHLVDDQAALVVSVQDAPGVLKQWKSSPWALTWADEQVRAFFAPMRDKLKVEGWDEAVRAETGRSIDELLGLATGEVLIAVPELTFALAEGTNQTPALLVAVQVGDNAEFVRKLIAQAAAKSGDVVETRDEFSGVTVHTDKTMKTAEDGTKTATSVLSWALADGVWLLSPEKERVFAAIDALAKGGVDDAFGKSESYLKIRDAHPTAQALALVNFRSVYPTLVELVERQKAAGKGSNPFVDPSAILPGLGLDALKSFYLVGEIGPDSTTVSGALTYSEAKGILKMIAYEEGPVTKAAFISPKWVSVSAAKFSTTQSYAALEETLAALSPGLAGLVQGQLAQFNNQLKIDLKRDLIGSLGSDLYSAYTVRPDAAKPAAPGVDDLEQFIAISLVNPAAFTKALDALKRIAGPAVEQLFVKREYLGATLYTFSTPAVEGAPPAKSFTYAIAGGHFLLSVGSAAPVESVLQALQTPQSSFWDRADVKDALAGVPDSAAFLQYQDVRMMIGVGFDALTKVANLGGGATEDENGEALDNRMVDPAAMPDPAVIARYWSHSVGYGHRDATGLYFTSKLVHPSK